MIGQCSGTSGANVDAPTPTPASTNGSMQHAAAAVTPPVLVNAARVATALSEEGIATD